MRGKGEDGHFLLMRGLGFYFFCPIVAVLRFVGVEVFPFTIGWRTSEHRALAKQEELKNGLQAGR